MRSKYEIKAQKLLESEGWLVDYKPRSRFAFGKVDFFNAFDLLAYKPKKLRFISIKGHAGASKKHQNTIRSFVMPRGCTKELWIWPRSNKGWIIKTP